MRSDGDLMENLKSGKEEYFQFLYETYYPSVQRFVLRNSGDAEDARDVFQEAIIVLLEKIRHHDFVLTSGLKTFIFAIAKNIWLKKLRERKRERLTETEDINQLSLSVEDDDVEKPMEARLASWLNSITENCARILKAMFFNKESIDLLMIKMGWKNKHTAANQKYKCLEQVKKVHAKEKEGTTRPPQQ
jgi:RNA polymerase sigma factor (sigma-70 family)